MKYVSIDLETTGLDPENNQILTFSGILEDTSKKLLFEELPKLNLYLLRSQITGSYFAINMNSKIVATVSRYSTLKTPEEKKGFADSIKGTFIMDNALPFYFYVWCLVYHEGFEEYKSMLSSENWDNYATAEMNMKAVATLIAKHGKVKLNVAGKNFSSFDKKFIDKYEKFYNYVIFRQRVLDPSVFFVDWETDQVIPDLTQCKERAGLDPFVSHESLDDAWDVIQLFRKSEQILNLSKK